MRYFEDFTVGETIELGSASLSAEEIIEFAQRYDPQPFHIDPDAAADTPFGGLIASGWQTAGVFMKMYVDTVLSDAASLGSPGVEELRWLRPVRPGTVLAGSLTILDTAPSKTDPNRGTGSVRSSRTRRSG